MSLRLSVYYAFRHFSNSNKTGRKKARHLLIPVLSIALSLIPVTVILVVANGMIEGIVLRYLEFETGHVRTTIDNPAYIPEIEDELPRLRQEKTVKAAYLERQGYGLLFVKGRRSFIGIRGVPKDIMTMDTGFGQFVTLTEGTFDLTRSHSIVIGKALADEFGIHLGDRLLVITHKTSDKKGEDLFVPRINRFRVTGIYTIGYQELDKRTVFISWEDGQAALSPNNSETYLKMKLVDPFTDIEKKAAFWGKEIHPQAVYWRVQPWNEINNNYYNAYQSTKVLLLVIMLFIVFVAAFNIISSMIMVVLDHLQEIGILKSLGASSASITFSYVCVGFLTGLISIVSGVAAGLFFAVNINEVFHVIDGFSTALASFAAALTSPFTGFTAVEPVRILNPEYYLEVIPIRINVWEVLGISLFALFLAIIFSFFQAWKAGRTRPIEVIRKH